MRKARKNKSASDERKPRFGAFSNGLQELTDEMVRQLDGDLRLSANITQVGKDESGYEVFLENGEKLSAKKLIFATPANITAKLLVDIAKESAEKLATIKHENIGTVTLIYREEDIQSGFLIHGLMIPRRENRAIDAGTYTSLKMPTRAPKSYGVIRVFFGGSKPNVAEVSDADLQKIVQDELASTIGITAEPIQIIPFRWLKSFPQANVGHMGFVDEIEKSLPEGIHLAGSSYRGIGVPDCIQQGRQAVKNAI